MSDRPLLLVTDSDVSGRTAAARLPWVHTRLNIPIIEDPWVDADAMNAARMQTDRLAEEVFEPVAQTIAAITKMNHTTKGWRVILWPWLLPAVHGCNTRRQVLARHCKDRQGMTITAPCGPDPDPPVSTKASYVHPLEPTVEDFLWADVAESTWIADPIASGNAPSSKKLVKDPSPPHTPFLLRIKQSALGLLELGLRRPTAIMHGLYTPWSMQARLWISSNGRLQRAPAIEWPGQNQADNALRQQVVQNLISDGTVPDWLARGLVRLLPLALLEDHMLVACSPQTRRLEKARFLVTSVGIEIDDMFRYAAANQINQGQSFAVLQHGGDYGIHEYHFHERIERDIAGAFLSRGWTDPEDARVIPLGIIADLPYSRTRRKPTGRALFGADSRLKVLRNLTATPWMALRLHERQRAFVSAIAPNFRSKLTIRLYRVDYGWNHRHRWETMAPEAKLTEWERSFMEELSRHDLYLTDHISTTFIQSMDSDCPTMVLWDPSVYAFNPDMQELVDELVNVGILITDPEEFASQIQEVLPVAEKWWQEPHRQEAVAAFLRHTMYRPKRPYRAVKRMFANLADMLQAI